MALQVALYLEPPAAVAAPQPAVEASGEVLLPLMLVERLLVTKALSAEVAHRASRRGKWSSIAQHLMSIPAPFYLESLAAVPA